MSNEDNIELLQQLVSHGGTQAFSLVPMALKKVLEEEQWQKRRDKHGTPFSSFEIFVTTKLWHGLESSIDDLLSFCRKHDDVKQLINAAVGAAPSWGGDHKSKDQVDNVNLKGGNSPTYALKRLKRDRPDLAEKVTNGELSANAAAIEAGFRRKPVKHCPNCGYEYSTTPRVTDDPTISPKVAGAAAATVRRRVFLRCAASALRKAEQGAGLKDARGSEIDDEILDALAKVIQAWTRLRDEMLKRIAPGSP